MSGGLGLRWWEGRAPDEPARERGDGVLKILIGRSMRYGAARAGSETRRVRGYRVYLRSEREFS